MINKQHTYFPILICILVFPLILAEGALRVRNDINIDLRNYSYISNTQEELDYNLTLLYKEKYHNLTEVYQELEYFNNSAPDLIDYSSIGISYNGNSIPLITLTNEHIPANLKGKTYIVAHHHAREMCTIENVIRLIRDLINSYSENYEINALLNRTIIYIIITLNPDSLDYTLYVNQHFRKSMKPYDDDGDGLLDEDSPEDLDGNGISQFWVYNKSNLDILDHYWEGIDRDNDGDIGEDPPGGVDLNRNYPFHWKDLNADTGATDDVTSFTYQGPNPLSENETHALDHFVKQHNFTHAMSLHSGVESPIFGWSWTKAMKQSEEEIYNSIVYYMKKNHLLPDSFFPINKISYTSAGEWGDYMYSNYHIIPLTLEIAGGATGQYPMILVYENETHYIYEKKFRDLQEFNPPAKDLELMHKGLYPFEVFWVSLTPNITVSSVSAKKFINGEHEITLDLSSGSKYWNTTDKSKIIIDSPNIALIKNYPDEIPVLVPAYSYPLKIALSSDIPEKMSFNVTVSSEYAADLIFYLEINSSDFKQVIGFDWIIIFLVFFSIPVYRRSKK